MVPDRQRAYGYPSLFPEGIPEGQVQEEERADGSWILGYACFRKVGEAGMTDNMFGYQICFGRKQHKKARWKKARKRWFRQYAKLCEKLGTQNDLQEGR